MTDDDIHSISRYYVRRKRRGKRKVTLEPSIYNKMDVVHEVPETPGDFVIFKITDRLLVEPVMDNSIRRLDHGKRQFVNQFDNVLTVRRHRKLLRYSYVLHIANNYC